MVEFRYNTRFGVTNVYSHPDRWCDSMSNCYRLRLEDAVFPPPYTPQGTRGGNKPGTKEDCDPDQTWDGEKCVPPKTMDVENEEGKKEGGGDGDEEMGEEEELELLMQEAFIEPYNNPVKVDEIVKKVLGNRAPIADRDMVSWMLVEANKGSLNVGEVTYQNNQGVNVKGNFTMVKDADQLKEWMNGVDPGDDEYYGVFVFSGQYGIVTGPDKAIQYVS